jgi:hypothetical protein
MSLAAATAPQRLHWQEVEPGKSLSFHKLLPLVKAAVAAAPDSADLKLQLARILFITDRMAEIVDWLRPVATRDDTDPELLYHLGRAALATRDCRIALDALRLAAAKDFRDAFGYLPEALAALDRTDEAIEVAFQALEHPSSEFRPLAFLARALTRWDDIKRLWTSCVALRARGAWGGYLPAVTVFAAARLGYDMEVATLMDPPRWFSAAQLRVRDDFNQNLSAELLAHSSLSSVPSAKATRASGTWIKCLQVFGGPLAKELLAQVRLAVGSYIARRQAFADDPMIAHRPKCVDLDSWASVVYRDGYQKWHIHPSGWISGVYYVDVPKLESVAGPAGEIEFGVHSFGNEDVRAPRWRVKPQPGLLLLFPSYYAHRTWPTGVSHRRISVAFDVIPSGAAPGAVQA